MSKIKYIGMAFFIAVIQLAAKVSPLYDTRKIQLEKLPQKPSEVYTGKDFTYEEALKEPDIFTRLINWIYTKIIELLQKIFNFNLKAETLSGREILWTILVFLLLVIIIIGAVFFFKKFNKTLGRNDKDSLSAEEAEKNINEVDFDKLISTAVKNKNYRLAIRFYYLKILKLMADNQLITYEYQKTNYEYFYEIENPELKNNFKEISFVFDYCWYGDHIAEESDYHIAVNKFIEIQKLVSNLQTSKS